MLSLFPYNSNAAFTRFPIYHNAILSLFLYNSNTMFILISQVTSCRHCGIFCLMSAARDIVGHLFGRPPRIIKIDLDAVPFADAAADVVFAIRCYEITPVNA